MENVAVLIFLQCDALQTDRHALRICSRQEICKGDTARAIVITLVMGAYFIGNF